MQFRSAVPQGFLPEVDLIPCEFRLIPDEPMLMHAEDCSFLQRISPLVRGYKKIINKHLIITYGKGKSLIKSSYSMPSRYIVESNRMGYSGLEPETSPLSGARSTTELIAH